MILLALGLVLAPAVAEGMAAAQPAPALSPVAGPPAPTAQPTGPRMVLSLPEAVFISLRDNRTVKAAYIARVAQKFDLFVAHTRFQPKGEIDADVNRTQLGSLGGVNSLVQPTATWLLPTGAQFTFGWSRAETRQGALRGETQTSSLSFVQPLLRGAGVAVNTAPVKIAELQERIDQLQLRSTVINTVTQVILSYRLVLQDQQQVAIAEQSLARARSLLETNRVLVDAGRLAAADLVQTRADIATQEVTLLQTRQALRSAQLQLLQLLALDLHTDVVAGDALDAAHVDIDVERAVDQALANRPDFLAQAASLGQAQQAEIVARNNRLWSLSVVGGYAHQVDGSGSTVTPDPVTGALTPTGRLPENSATVGLQLRIPVGDYTLRQAEIQAVTQVRQQRVQLDDLREQVEAQVRDSVQSVELTWRQLEAARQARALAAETLTLERERLAAGRASNFEVISYEVNLRNAENQELNAEVTYLNALTTLDQQLGGSLDTWRISLNS